MFLFYTSPKSYNLISIRNTPLMNIVLLICWCHPAVLMNTDLFWVWWLRGESSYAAVCLTSPPVMGKSLLHRVSLCQKDLSAVRIWHREKVEGESGCKVASCGCRLKRGPSYLHRLKVCLVSLKEKLPTGTRLCGPCFPCPTVEQPRIIRYNSDLMFTFTNDKAWGTFSSTAQQEDGLNHAHTVVLCNSEVGVAAIPSSIRRQPSFCSYFCLLAVCASEWESTKKAEHMFPHQKPTYWFLTHYHCCQASGPECSKNTSSHRNWW